MNKKISNNPFQIQRLMTDVWWLVIFSHDSKVGLSPKWSGVKGLASGYPFFRACNAIYDSEQVAGSFYVINQVKNTSTAVKNSNRTRNSCNRSVILQSEIAFFLEKWTSQTFVFKLVIIPAFVHYRASLKLNVTTSTIRHVRNYYDLLLSWSSFIRLAAFFRDSFSQNSKATTTLISTFCLASAFAHLSLITPAGLRWITNFIFVNKIKKPAFLFQYDRLWVAWQNEVAVAQGDFEVKNV